VLHRNHRATGSIPAREPIVALSVTALSWPGLITLEISIYKILQQLIDNSHYRLILKLGKEMQINHHS
jgi:hypothetical protein